MKHSIKRKLSVVLAALLLLTSLVIPTTASAAQSDSSAVASSYGLPDKIDDGAILHCWCWNFNTIKANIPQIAAAGFKSVQTSPINQVWVGDNGGMKLMSTNNTGKWWYQYQPTDYVIGNYQLGTKDEFMAMCQEAHRYGVKVIVDIVANHCASDYSVISSHVKNIGGKVFHNRLEITDWTNRYQVTQGKLSGLYDLNTQSTIVQQMIVDYMTEVLASGADGFRFDAAKHIELPDDDPEGSTDFSGNFWPTVLDNDAEFQYGEILTGADRAADYAAMMKITADSYGSNLRTALTRPQLTATNMKNYRVTGVDGTRLVTWVESHDNYTTDDNPANGQYSSWYTLDNARIRQGWAIIASQGDATPLFFARPKGSTAGPDGNKWGDNTIGIAGDGNYYTDEVKAVNHFRNAMVGEPKNTRMAVTKYVGVIERGTKGAVLVNVDSQAYDISTATNLADGTYTDQAHGGTFTVTNGTLTGNIKAGEVVVLYTPEEDTERQIGDINNDGKVTIDDATMLQRHLAEFTNEDGSPIIDVDDPEEFRVADTNKDNRVSIQDVTKIQRVIAEIETF